MIERRSNVWVSIVHIHLHDGISLSIISVYGLYMLETAQTALSTGDAMRWFAQGFGNMISLTKPFFSAIDAPIMDGIIAFAVQIFFCWRIWLLSKSWLFALAIGLVSRLFSIAASII